MEGVAEGRRVGVRSKVAEERGVGVGRKVC